MNTEISKLRVAFGKCDFSAHKDMGLRRLREAKQFMTRNPAHAQDMLSQAKFHLQYAEAITERNAYREAV